MSASVRRLYAVRETDPAPCAIPAPPAAARFVPLEDRLETTAVYGSGPICTENLRGFIRYDDGRAASDRPAFVARTRGNASKPADMRSFTSREAAVEWLSRAIDGVIPRKPWQRKTLAVTALLACLAAPALAEDAAIVTSTPHWVRPVADGETPLQAPAPAPHRHMQAWTAPEKPDGVCLYAGQPYSIGAVLNGSVCARDPRTADTEAGAPPQAPRWMPQRGRK